MGTAADPADPLRRPRGGRRSAGGGRAKTGLATDGAQPTLDGRLALGCAAAAAAIADCRVASLSEDLGSDPEVWSAVRAPEPMLASSADDGLLILKDLAARKYMADNL